jgi:hypothetical protein
VWELRPGSPANSVIKLGPPGGVSRAAPSPVLRRHNRTLVTRPDFRLFPVFFIVLRIVFSIVFHCSCAGVFFDALSMACIVIGVDFPL